jgi:predicted metal-dependent hydrolase
MGMIAAAEESPASFPSCPLPADAERIAGILRRWYRTEADRVISQRFVSIWGSLPAGRIPGSLISPCGGWRRWGSCSASGTVTLNPYLVCAPLRCVDYVILHELCHRLVHNHGKGYYRVLAELLPGWKEARKELKAQPFVYI